MLSEANSLCVVPVDHPLAQKQVIHASDLKGEAFISFSNDTLYRIRVDRVFDELGIVRKMRIETRTTQVACNLVAEGAGVSIVGSWDVAGANRADICLRDFEPAIPIAIGALIPARKASSRRVEMFVDVLTRTYNDSLLSHKMAKV